MPKGIYDHSKNRHVSGYKIANTSNMCGHHPKSEFKKGSVPWNKGKSGWLSEDHKKRLSEANANKVAWNKGLYGIQSGENNPNWKGGRSVEEKRLRRTKQWGKWRLDVFEKDNYTCKHCGAKSGSNYDGVVYLEAHHIFRVHDLFINNLKNHIFNVDNGQTLCRHCHLLVTATQRRSTWQH